MTALTGARRRLVLWNIDLTLVDVAQVTRAAYADAFRRVTGRPLVQVPPMTGSTESEIFFQALALNTSACPPAGQAEDLLGRFTWQLAAAFHARRDQLARLGRLLPGAAEAVAGVGRLPGTVQTVAVATGRFSAGELHGAGADVVLGGLADTAAVVRAVGQLSGAPIR